MFANVTMAFQNAATTGEGLTQFLPERRRVTCFCDAERRQQLIEQRQRLLEQEATQASGREVKPAAPVTLPAQETQSDASVGAGNGIVTQDPSPATPQDAVSQHMESIRTAATWKGSQPENHAGMFGPWPEEYE